VRSLMLIVAGAAVLANGCSLVLSWDPAGLPCDTSKTPYQCASGYSCLGDKCVPDGSLGEGVTCQQRQQCAKGLFCAPRLSTCQILCTQFFQRDPSCPKDYYCRPVYTVGSDNKITWQGACLASDCKTAQDCSSNRVPLNGNACVEVTDVASACLTSCTIGSNCTDNTETCQPVGTTNNEQLVCLVSGSGTGGAVCEPLLNPCAAGYACISGYCRQYCNGTCSSGQCCTCHNANSNVTYYYCADTCTSC
jgi:hypothetical protein